MFSPTNTSAIVRPDLAPAVNEHVLDNAGLIADLVMPFVPVGTPDFQYPIFELEQLANIPQTKRANGTEANTVSSEINRGTGVTEWHCLKEIAPDRDVARYGGLFNLHSKAAGLVVDALRRAREARVAALLINETTFPPSGETGETLSNTWDHATNGTPITDVARGKEKIVGKIGKLPNTLIIPYPVAVKLSQNAQIRGAQPGAVMIDGNVDAAMLQRAFGVERVLVPTMSYNTAKAGQTASMSPGWNKDYAVLCYVGNPMLEEPAVGYSYYCRATDGMLTTLSYRDEKLRGDWIEAGMDVLEKVLVPEAAYLIKNIAA